MGYTHFYEQKSLYTKYSTCSWIHLGIYIVACQAHPALVKQVSNWPVFVKFLVVWRTKGSLARLSSRPGAEAVLRRPRIPGTRQYITNSGLLTWRPFSDVHNLLQITSVWGNNQLPRRSHSTCCTGTSLHVSRISVCHMDYVCLQIQICCVKRGPQRTALPNSTINYCAVANCLLLYIGYILLVYKNLQPVHFGFLYLQKIMDGPVIGLKQL